MKIFPKVFSTYLRYLLDGRFKWLPRRVEPDKLDSNLKFHYETCISLKWSRGDNLLLHKAVNVNGEFAWIDKRYFPENDNEEFYLIIVRDLNSYSSFDDLIALSFNLFRNRQDFYSKYTFVKTVKK